MPSRVWSVFSLIHLIFTTMQTTSTSLRNPSTPRNRNPRLTGLNHKESYNSNKKPRGRGLHTGWMQYCLCIIRSAILTQAPPLWSAGRHSLTSRHKYLTEISPCFFFLDQKCIPLSFLNQFLAIGMEKHVTVLRMNYINKLGVCLENIKGQMNTG